MTPQTSLAELVQHVAEKPGISKDALQRLKLEFARSHGLPRFPSDADLLEVAPEHLRGRLEPTLRVKPTRTASGVAVVSVMTAPHACPHGTCTYCPGGPRFGTPQSYTGTEPAAMRAAQFAYDPRAQTRARIEQLHAIGHRTDKVDLIVLGGTFTSLEPRYQEWFIARCFDGLNGFDVEGLAAAHRANESADSRCIGLTVETKPDRFLGPEVEFCVRLGATRVELGVQSTHDDVLLRAHRGHTDADARHATRRAKEAGLKVGYHMMPALPGSDVDRDLESLRAIFDDTDYRPDLLKIYPTLVVRGTALYGLWARGDYRGMTNEEAVELVAKVKAMVPPWVRIHRIQREISAADICAGPTRGDLRNLARARLAARGLRCRCIRCREIGLQRRALSAEEVMLHRTDYDASGGREVFLSFEDPEERTLVGYARLRIGDVTAYVRELKVFGEVVPLREAPHGRWQHRGYGRRLMVECERIARDEFDRPRLYVTSGVGVRGYYRGLGYDRDGPYMARPL